GDGAGTGSGAGDGSAGVVVDAGEAVAGPSGDVEEGVAFGAASPWAEKYSAQLGSTLDGSSCHCSRSASTSHWLGPNSEESESCVCCDTLRSPAFALARDADRPQPSGRTGPAWPTREGSTCEDEPRWGTSPRTGVTARRRDRAGPRGSVRSAPRERARRAGHRAPRWSPRAGSPPSARSRGQVRFLRRNRR